MKKNICHFIPFHKDHHSIHTINFVLETMPNLHVCLRSEAVYKMYYVCSGRGAIHTTGKITPLAEGDVFFSFPAVSFFIESIENFTYMYISFVGYRANEVMDFLKINSNNFVFHNAHEVSDFWKKGLMTNQKVIDLISESILLYTFSFLGTQLITENNQLKQHQSIDLIKKYVDDHFTDCNFSLEKMSCDLSYNTKYISHLFKKTFGIGIIKYLNTIRIQNACTMIEQGFSSVNDIATKCGYSDPQYFSKIFKGKMGVTPTQHIKEIQTKQKGAVTKVAE